MKNSITVPDRNIESEGASASADYPPPCFSLPSDKKARGEEFPVNRPSRGRNPLRSLAVFVLACFLLPSLAAPGALAQQTRTITSVDITSDPGPDETYGAGEKIKVKVTFSGNIGYQCINCEGVGSSAKTDSDFTLTIGSNSRNADVEVRPLGINNVQRNVGFLMFTYTVLAADSDTDGISFAANSLVKNDAYITSTGMGTPDATLTHGAKSFSTHKVDGSQSEDTTAPTLSGTTVNGEDLTITFSEKLDPNSQPGATAFTLKVDGTAVGLTPGNIEGSSVKGIVNPPVVSGQTVTVSYSKPSTNPLQDFTAGNDVESFTDKPVTNSTPATAPGAPTSLTAEGGHLKADLGWTAPSSDGGSGITGYEYRRSTTSAGLGSAAWNDIPDSAAGEANDASYAVTGLTNGTTYYFQVRASNVVGDGAKSNDASATPAPATTGARLSIAPAAASVTEGEDVKFTLTFSDHAKPMSDTIASGTVTLVVEVEETGDMLAAAPPTTFTITLSTTSGGTQPTSGNLATFSLADKVKYGSVNDTTDESDSRVTVRLVSGSFVSNDAVYNYLTSYKIASPYEAAVTVMDNDEPPEPPMALGSLTADRGNGQVRLNWTAPSSGATPTGYEYRYARADRTLPPTWSAASGGTSHTVTGLTNGTEYTFEVRARNAVGPGPASSVRTTPATVPGQVRNLGADPGDGQVTLSWLVPSSNGGSAVAGYEYRYARADRTLPPTWNAASGGTSHTVPGLTNDTEYTFEVRARNAVGPGTASNVMSTPAAPPAVGSIELSEPAAGDTYAAGESIDVTVNFTKDVAVANPGGVGDDTASLPANWSPSVGLEVGSALKTLPLRPQNRFIQNGALYRGLVFHYTVAEGDTDEDGVEVTAGSLDLGGVAFKVNGSSTLALDERHAARAFANRKVDGVRPRLSTADVDGDSLALTYEENLYDASVPAAGDFTVTVAGDARAISASPVVSGTRVTLTLSSAVTHGQVVAVSYTPGTNPIRDEARNAALALDNQSVMNITGLPEVKVSFGQSSYPAVTEGGTVAVAVTLSEAPGRTVEIRVEGTGAPEADDYSISPPSVTFGSGDIERTFTFTALADGRDEDRETVTLGFTEALPNRVSLGAVDSTVLTIEDNDAEPALGIRDAEAREGTSAEFEVTLVPESGREVTVDYAISDGTASAPSDYASARGTLTFAAGETVKTVTVVVVDDADPEPKETFTVTLENPVNATLPSDATATGTILASDSPITPPRNLSASPGDGSVSLSWTAPEASGDAAVAGYEYRLSETSGEYGGSQWTAIPDAASHTVRGLSNGVTYYFEVRAVDSYDGRSDPSNEASARPRQTRRPPTAAAGEDLMVTQGEEVVLDGSGSRDFSGGGNLSYMWRYAGERNDVALVDADGATATFTAPSGLAEDLVLEFELTVTDASPGGLSASDTVSVEVTSLAEIKNGRIVFSPKVGGELSVGGGTVRLEVLPAGNAVPAGLEFELPLDFVTRGGVSRISFNLQPQRRPGPPSGYMAAGTAVDINMDAELAGGARATVCLPGEAEDSRQPELYRYDEGGEMWKSLVSGAETRGGADVVCAQTAELSLFGVFFAVVEDSPRAAAAKAWLSRFGRTVAARMVETIGERVKGDSQANPGVIIGGQRFGKIPELPKRPEARFGGENVFAEEEFQTMDLRETLLSGSSISVSSLPREDEGGPGSGWTFWARVDVGQFDGEGDGLTISSDVIRTGALGVDYNLGQVLFGVALSHSRGEGEFSVMEEGTGGELESSVTGAHPYARFALGERLSVWGTLGYGRGEMSMVEDGQPVRTDISMKMGAFGLRGDILRDAAPGSFNLAVKSDVFAVRTESEETGGLESVEADASRLRVTLEGSRDFKLGSGGVFTPLLEAGFRRDGGDAERGMGFEMGGGLRYDNPDMGLAMEIRARGLLVHERSGYEEWGVGGSLRFGRGSSDRGFSFRADSSLGAVASGVRSLWTSGDASGLAAGDFEPQSSLDIEMGYGFRAFGGDGILVPYAGYAFSGDGNRTQSVGGRLSVGRGFSLSLQGDRTESVGADAERGIMLRGLHAW